MNCDICLCSTKRWTSKFVHFQPQNLELLFVKCKTVSSYFCRFILQYIPLLDMYAECSSFKVSISSLNTHARCDENTLDCVAGGPEALMKKWFNHTLSLTPACVCVCVCAVLVSSAVLHFQMNWVLPQSYTNEKWKRMDRKWRIKSPLWIKEPWNYSLAQQNHHSDPAPELFEDTMF